MHISRNIITAIRMLLGILLVGSMWFGQSACKHKGQNTDSGTEVMIDSLVPQYSHSFRVEYYKDYKLVKVYKEDNAQLVSTYVLCRKEVRLPKELESATRIETPVSRIACLSTTHIGALKLLDARGFIAAAANTNLICDSAVLAMIAGGRVKDAGKDYQPDYEVIAQVKPQLLFSDGENGGSPQINGKLKALNIRIASSRDYFEQEPLARAEWIKFFAAFIDKEKTADSIFDRVKWSYIETKGNVAEIGNRPTVFCNLPYNGVWYMPCGKNYVARLITDAGGTFLWNEDKPINGLNLTLNFEQVYERAVQADFWINPARCTDAKQVLASDAKFKLFKAFKAGHIYNCTKRLSPGGGMDMWETGTFRPDIVLSDLALVFHSGSSPVGLYYYLPLR